MVVLQTVVGWVCLDFKPVGPVGSIIFSKFDTVRMIYVLIQERFHGVLNPKPFYQKYATREAARNYVERWNSLNENDHLYVLEVRDSLPPGAKKNRYGLYLVPSSGSTFSHGHVSHSFLDVVNRVFQ